MTPAETANLQGVIERIRAGDIEALKAVQVTLAPEALLREFDEGWVKVTVNGLIIHRDRVIYFLEESIRTGLDTIEHPGKPPST